MKQSSKSGFSVAEMIMALAIGSLLLGSFAVIFGAWTERITFREETITHNGNVYHRLPSMRVAHEMNDLAAWLSLRSSRPYNVVHVIGGERSNPTTGEAIRVPTLEEMRAAFQARQGRVPLVTNSYHFAQYYFPTDWNHAPTGDAREFLFFLLPNVDSVETDGSMLFGGMPLRFHRTHLWSSLFRLSIEDLGDGRTGYTLQLATLWLPRSSGIANVNIFSTIRFFTTAEDEAAMGFIGARNYWYRWDDTWKRFEQGPTVVVLPDPMRQTRDVQQFQLADGFTAPISPYTFLFGR